jgi:hypothetical protein
MKAAALIIAQLHRNPQLLSSLHNDAEMRYESVPVRRRARRLRRR